MGSVREVEKVRVGSKTPTSFCILSSSFPLPLQRMGRGRTMGMGLARSLRCQEAEEVERNYTTLHNILHSKKGKEEGANKQGAGTRINP